MSNQFDMFLTLNVRLTIINTVRHLNRYINELNHDSLCFFFLYRRCLSVYKSAYRKVLPKVHGLLIIISETTM